MQLSYLRTFIVVVEQRGFSAATQALGISQPAVSQQVQRLERELGVTLLRRGRRGVVVSSSVARRRSPSPTKNKKSSSKISRL